MRVLRAVVASQSLLVQTREANFAKCRSIRSQFVGDDNCRNEALAPKEFAEQAQRGGLIALGLNKDLKHLAFAISFAFQTARSPFHQDATACKLSAGTSVGSWQS